VIEPLRVHTPFSQCPEAWWVTVPPLGPVAVPWRSHALALALKARRLATDVAAIKNFFIGYSLLLERTCPQPMIKSSHPRFALVFARSNVFYSIFSDA
jgi:hypothetical protein